MQKLFLATEKFCFGATLFNSKVFYLFAVLLTEKVAAQAEVFESKFSRIQICQDLT